MNDLSQPKRAARGPRNRWVGLLRVSSVSQVDGEGLDVQEATIRAWGKTQHATFAAFEVDAGVSGDEASFGARLGFHAALERVKQGEVEGIVVAKLDRLAREVMLQEYCLAQIRAAGGRLVSCVASEQELLTADGDPGREMLRVIMGAVAQYERAMIKARTAAGQASARSKGLWMGGAIPYGWQLGEDGKLYPDQRQWEIIGQARTLRDEFNVPLVDVGEYMLADGFRLKRTKQLGPSQTADILKRARLKGSPPPLPLGPMARQFAGMPQLRE